MAAPTMANKAMASLAAGPGAKGPFAVVRPPTAAPSLAPRRRALVVRAIVPNTPNKDKSPRDRLKDAFALAYKVPERINGRLAMVGFVSALAVEAYRGDSLLSQAGNGTGLAWFAGTAAVLSLASLVPLLKGETAEDRSDGIMTADVEIWNGRLAMVGLIALAFTEYIKGTPIIDV